MRLETAPTEEAPLIDFGEQAMLVNVDIQGNVVWLIISATDHWTGLHFHSEQVNVFHARRID